MHIHHQLLLLPLLALPLVAVAQESEESRQNSRITLTGSVQSDNLIPLGKQDDGSNADFRSNTYIDLNAGSKYVDAGLRFEYLDHPLPGFENDFKGWGLPYYYIKGKLKNVELTVGTFYEQFGSGFVLRTYEERSLGIDNSLLGGRIVVTPFKGVRLKALSGEQRRYWAHNDSWITGGDAEFSLDEWFQGLAAHGTRLMVGGSWVNNHEKASHNAIFADPTHRLVLPENVNAWDARIAFSHGAWDWLAEYARKTQDPLASNGWIYRPGYVAMLSGSYSKKGFSLLAQAKRSVNFDFRSKRDELGTSSHINHLPAFTQDQTYALPAMYPYATHPSGEWAYQVQMGYKFKRNTVLGGRYGMNFKVNFSHVHAIKQTDHPLTYIMMTEVPDDGQLHPADPANVQVTSYTGRGTYGYGSSFWSWGDGTYYQDINVQLERRLARDFKLTLMYMNQFYNKTIVEGEGGMVHSNIFVADGLFNLSPKTRLRTELQYLTTADDKGDWLFALAELSLVPHWMFTVSDEYNAGQTKSHYWLTAVTYNLKAHRLQLGWGRTRAGFNCSGGVCRYVPETKGFTLSYNYNF
ncbi:MAG: DUF6029 family protein [Prevotella sp.]|nr:DUF6029 family protein [Prevotella sp.]